MSKRNNIDENSKINNTFKTEADENSRINIVSKTEVDENSRINIASKTEVDENSKGNNVDKNSTIDSAFKTENDKNLLNMEYLALAFRNAILGKEPISFDSSVDFNVLFELSKKHAVVLAVFDSVKHSKCPESIMKKWSEEAGKAITKELLFDNELSKIEKKFSESEIPFVFIKGIIIKSFYSKKGLRQFCDYDILIDKKRADDVKKIMISLGYSVSREKKSEEEISEAVSVIECKKNPIFNFELHKKLFWGTEKGYFENFWERIVFDNSSSFKGRMTDEDVYLYHIAHLCSHLRERSGAGIRYLSDHYVLKKNLFEKKGFNRKYVEKILIEENLLEFEKYFDECSNNLFEAEKINVSLLDEFIKNGVHGTLDNKVRLSLKKNNAFSYTIRRIFLPLNQMSTLYSVLLKYPFLLPVYWVHRFFVIVLNKEKRKTAKSELSLVFKAKKNK